MTNPQGSILIVEDDASIRRSLKTTLSALGFDLGEAANGEAALLSMRLAHYDTVLLDLNMPGMGGMEACRQIRHEFPRVAILIVTVRDSEEDKIEALDAGADDYIAKPFRIGELTARLRAAIRRVRSPIRATVAPLQIGIFELHPERRLLKKRGDEIHLTPTEFDLLTYLMAHAERPILHAKLLSTVWGPEYGEEREYLRTYISQLRRKLEDDPARPAYLKTVNYLGYVFHNGELSGSSWIEGSAKEKLPVNSG